MADQAVELFHTLMRDNNLSVNISQLKARYLQDGAVLVDNPSLVVSFTKAPEEEDEFVFTGLTPLKGLKKGKS